MHVRTRECASERASERASESLSPSPVSPIPAVIVERIPSFNDRSYRTDQLSVLPAFLKLTAHFQTNMAKRVAAFRKSFLTGSGRLCYGAERLCLIRSARMGAICAMNFSLRPARSGEPSTASQHPSNLNQTEQSRSAATIVGHEVASETANKVVPRRLSAWSQGLLAVGLMSAGMMSLSLPSQALAVDDNIRLTNLYLEDNPDAQWNVSSSDQRQLLFQNLSRDLGMAVSTQMLSPGETLGAYGFELGLDNRLFVVPTTQRDPTDSPEAQYTYDRADAWRVMDDDHRLTLGSAMLLPTLRLRKGLPYSTEVGVDMTWIGFSQQAAFSGYGRIAINEGLWEKEMRLIPDVAFSLAGSRFMGNSQLDLSTFEWNLTMGYTFPVAGVRDSYVGTFSPFVGVGVLYITSSPAGSLPGRVNDLQGVTGLHSREVAEDPNDASVRPVVFNGSFQPLKFNIGARITSGMFRWLAGVEFTGGGEADPITLGSTNYGPETGFFGRPRLTIGTGFVY